MPKPTQWYEIQARAKSGDAPATAEIFIYGNIGDRWDENGVIAAELVRELSGLDVEQINVRINSYGGSVPDGIAIFNALRRHPAQVDTFVDGVAISCASLLAMAGKTITMAENAQLMIHAPWSYAVGNSNELRAQADVLDRHAKAMASAYVRDGGSDLEACVALLTDGKDHWYTASEAKEAGFADVVGDPIAIAASLANSFNLTRFTTTAARAAATPKETLMPKPNEQQAAADASAAAAAASATAGASPAAVPFARTKDLNTQVIAMFKPFIARDGIAALQTAVLADPALTLEQIQAQLLVEIGKDGSPANPAGAHPRVEVLEDEGVKMRGAAVTALLIRAGVERDAKIIAAQGTNPYRGAKLLDLARASLERAGVRHATMSQLEVVAAAFTQSTSDFPILLENTMHKALLGAYAIAPLTWPRFCARGSVSDFRAHNRYRTGSFGNLDAKNELGEFKNKSIPDGEKASITAATKGNIVNLSREAVINDDLGAFIGLSAMLGQAAARTVEVDVYALLALNAGLGPTQSDAQPLFHSNRANVSTGAALAMAAIDADRVVMALQKDVSSNDYLDLRPSVLLLPIGLGGTARSINDAQYDPDTANKLQKPNTVRGLFRDVIDTPRLTGTRRYLFADPAVAPVIEVAFLDGQDTPYLELQNGFDVDGARWKVRLDYGIAAVDFRGAVTNAGA